MARPAVTIRQETDGSYRAYLHADTPRTLNIRASALASAPTAIEGEALYDFPDMDTATAFFNANTLPEPEEQT